MERKVYEFISRQTNDPIVERKTCAVSGQEFPIYQSDVEFYNKISPVFNGKKYSIPTPTLCPDERQRRRLVFRNERKLYKRKCDATGRDMVSIYSQDKPYKVFEQKFWWSDNRDAMNYGRDYDVNVSCFDQIKSLMCIVPKASLNVINCENCDYCTYISHAKNCYICFGCSGSTDAYYTNSSMSGNMLIDCMGCSNTTIAYQSINCQNCFKVFYSTGLKDCSECFYCVNMVGSKFCFMSSNLVNKEYYIKNKQYTQQEYFNELNNLRQEKSDQELLGECMNIQRSMLVSSEVIFPTKKEGDTQEESLVSKHVGSNGGNIVMAYDSDYLSRNGEKCYESIGSGIYEIMFSVASSQSNLLYCDSCSSCQNCFACVGLVNKEYCIFNKQYTKENYQIQVAEIIENMIRDGEWGEFFNPSLSAFAYNESSAYDSYPLAMKEALEKGYLWQENNYDALLSPGVQLLKGDQIPVESKGVTDDILQKIFVCEVSNRPYRVIKQELDFYRTYGLPLPRKHPDVRYEERLVRKPKRSFYLNNCDKCSKEMISMGDSDYQGKIYCKDCYTKEIYG